MEKLYKKSEITFAIMLIIIYCILQSLANPLNELIGIEYLMSAVFCALQAVFIICFIKKNNLSEKYGLCKAKVPASRLFFYIPLLVLVTRNFWNGFSLNLPIADTICYLVCMLFVGFVEEIVFRGFLYKAMAKDNEKTAIIVSSITFGLGHLLNLVNGSGAALLENLFQVTGAIAIGFLFVIIFSRVGSLWPLILTHSLINMTSAFANENGLSFAKELIFQAVLILVSIAYSIIIIKALPKENLNKE